MQPPDDPITPEQNRLLTTLQQDSSTYFVHKANPAIHINQAPIVMMIEKYRCGFLCLQMRQCPYLVTRLRCAGSGG